MVFIMVSKSAEPDLAGVSKSAEPDLAGVSKSAQQGLQDHIDTPQKGTVFYAQKQTLELKTVLKGYALFRDLFMHFLLDKHN